MARAEDYDSKWEYPPQNMNINIAVAMIFGQFKSYCVNMAVYPRLRNRIGKTVDNILREEYDMILYAVFKLLRLTEPQFD